MAFNPYSGGIPTAQQQGGGGGGGGNLLEQLKAQMGQKTPKAVARKGPQGKPGRPKGTQRRKGGSDFQGGPMTPPRVPAEAQLPEVPMVSESPPLGVNYAVARNLGNGGYRNGGF